MSQQKKRKFSANEKKHSSLLTKTLFQEKESGELSSEVNENEDNLVVIKEEPAYYEYEEIEVDRLENQLFGNSNETYSLDEERLKGKRQIKQTKGQKHLSSSTASAKNEVPHNGTQKALQNIINKQRAALKYLHIVLTRFQSVTDDLQELIELDLLEEQLDTLSMLQSQSNIQNFQAKSKFSQPRKRRKHLESPPKSPFNPENVTEIINLGTNQFGNSDLPLNAANDAQETISLASREPNSEKYLFIQEVDEEFGDGVFTSKKIMKGEKITEFSGELYEKLAKSSTCDFSFFEFDFHGLIMCVDASRNTCLGKSIRHDVANPNCRVEVEIVDDGPRLFFYSIKDILLNEELTCNYRTGRCKRINFESNEYIPDKCSIGSGEPATYSIEKCKPEFSAVKYDASDEINNHSSTADESELENHTLLITPNFLPPEVLIASPGSSMENSTEFEDKKIVVRQCSKTTLNKRIYDKKQACLFCGKLDFKIARHWNIAHSTHKIIRKLNSLPPGRTKINFQSLLRLQGNYYHNIKVLENGSGELLVVRRSAEKYDVTDFLPCPHCYGFFNMKEMTRHVASCVHRNWNHQELMQLLEESGLLGPSQVYANSVN